MSAASLILIVEDDPALRRLLVGALTRDGYAVVGLDGGRACARWLQDHTDRGAPRPALVISDVRMPAGDGLQLLAALKATLPDLPVVLMTAFGDGEVHRRAREGGAVAVLDKPVDLDLLRARILGLVHA